MALLLNMNPYDAFLQRHPAYATTYAVDDLRANDCARIDAGRQVYLDYTGGALHAASQVQQHLGLLSEQVLGNPHSVNPTSMAMTAQVERARAAVLTWFNGTGAYTAIFTANASSALKLVGEAFPAQSNFSGVKHPLALIDQAQAQGWQVLLDAAAFVPTNRLDLQVHQPDFVALSFYKMFGYPTGVGCLLVRNPALPTLRRPWFGGGTVNFATVQGRMHALSAGEAGFEDGTLNYLSIPAVEIGLQHLQRVGMDIIQTRVHSLTEWLLTGLLDLRHRNGRPLVRLYGPVTMADRGGTVTLNFYDPDGHLVDYRRVEELAAQDGISLRTGCFCNPGAGESAEDITEEDLRAGVANAGAQINLQRFLHFLQQQGGKSAGAIRVSLGLASNFADVAHFLAFAAGLRDQTALTIGTVTFDIESCRVVRDGG